jgi:hypothetical protein
MSVSGIFSNFTAQSAASVQNQQRTQKQFQQLAQELQSGNLSSAQTTTLQSQGLQTNPATSLQAGSSTATSAGGTVQSDMLNCHAHSHHRMPIRMSGTSGVQSSNSSSPTEPGQTAQSGIASTAQQSYTNVQQDFQQIALNSDLLNAQSATLESSGLSVMI